MIPCPVCFIAAYFGSGHPFICKCSTPPMRKIAVWDIQKCYSWLTRAECENNRKVWVYRQFGGSFWHPKVNSKTIIDCITCELGIGKERFGGASKTGVSCSSMAEASFVGEGILHKPIGQKMTIVQQNDIVWRPQQQGLFYHPKSIIHMNFFNLASNSGSC